MHHGAFSVFAALMRRAGLRPILGADVVQYSARVLQAEPARSH